MTGIKTTIWFLCCEGSDKGSRWSHSEEYSNHYLNQSTTAVFPELKVPLKSSAFIWHQKDVMLLQIHLHRKRTSVFTTKIKIQVLRFSNGRQDNWRQRLRDRFDENKIYLKLFVTSVKARVLLGEMKKQRLNAAAKTKKKSDDNAWISTKNQVKPAWFLKDAGATCDYTTAHLRSVTVLNSVDLRFL